MMSEKKKLISKIIENFKKLPRMVQTGVMALFLIMLSEWIPWEWFGEMGSYIQAGMILGGIFMLVRIFEQYQKKQGEKK